ncbi:EAL domain-containing protein [Pseudomonas sp. ChxA]|uniref:EAL domain-containing protein n=1 Tax=unclassified Pseudomonas TaxID=196821 RepID=UPI000BFE3D26|nr:MULTISPECIES: EAL domain-containing protein [unclassified Pseudomonas]ATN08290.1 hypothetical protein CRN80_00815 [Pseudomonas sp. FDAARGOS_380]MDL2189301.1 EAL domain-containing protein [Pseudomonas sp. ChxA]
MRRKYLRNWAALGAIIYAISVIAFSAYFAVRSGTERARDDLSDVADEVIRRSVTTQSQVDEVVTAQRTAGLAPCSPDHVALMRRLLLNASYLKDLAYIKGDDVLCSALYLSTAPIHLGPASHTTGTGGRRWNRLILPNAPDTTFVINERDGYAAIITPSLVLDVEDDKPDVSITHFRNVNQNVVRSRGTFKSEWLINYIGQPTSFFDTDYLVTIKLSSDGDSSVLAAMPKARVNQMVLAAIPTYLVAGILAGVGGAILLCAFARQRLSFRSQILDGLKKGEFFLLYQPVMNLGTGGCVGAEALLRWNQPERGIISPDIFIPAAESKGLMKKITERVIEIVREDATQLFKDCPSAHIAINVSAEDIHSKEIEQQLLELIRVTAARPKNIMIEVTERGLIVPDKAKKVLESIRANGFKIAIDDFGMGNSSLSYLSTYDLDFLKIDKAFVSEIGSNRVSKPLLFNIIEIGRSQGLQMIAEGVETKEQRDVLVDAGVHFAQGWFFAKPMPINDFRNFLCNRRGLAQGDTQPKDDHFHL